MEFQAAASPSHLGHGHAPDGAGSDQGREQVQVSVQKVPPAEGQRVQGAGIQPRLHVVNNGKILSRDGKHVGTATGGNARQCRMEGCKGERIGVRWDDGKLTFPCTAAFQFDKRRKMWKLL